MFSQTGLLPDANRSRFCRAFSRVISRLITERLGDPQNQSAKACRYSLQTRNNGTRWSTSAFPPQPPTALNAPPILDAPAVGSWLPAFQNCHATTQACHTAFSLGPCLQPKPINRLAAHNKSRAQCVCDFTVWRGWRAEREGQAAPAVAKPPSPAIGRLAASCKCRARRPVWWMGTPV